MYVKLYEIFMNVAVCVCMCKIIPNSLTTTTLSLTWKNLEILKQSMQMTELNKILV